MKRDEPITIMPFHLIQEIFNRFYYQKGTRYAEDFKTYASSGTRIAYSEAEDHHAYFKHLKRVGDLPEPIRILELGGGNGNNAARYLEKLKALDRERRTRFYERVQYILTDFSESMLEDVGKNRLIRKHMDRISLELVDARKMVVDEQITCVRFNELYNDLPTKIILVENGEFYEIYLAIYINPRVRIRTKDGGVIARREFALMMEEGRSELNEVDGSIVRRMEFEVLKLPTDVDVGTVSLVMKAFGRLPENYLIPIPIGGAENLLQLKKNMPLIGRVDFFDYGFMDLRELGSLQSSIFRTPGALTSFVNLPFITTIAEMAGFARIIIEPQNDYIRRIRRGRFTHKISKVKRRRSRNHFYHVHMSF